MKKLTILLLAVLLLVGTLSACGSSSGAPASSAASAASAASGSESPAQEPEKIGGTLNLLVMAGYEEDQIIKPFEEMYGVKVNAKIYPTSDQMFAMLQNAKEGEWDIVTPDTPWVDKLVQADLIDELNPADYPEIENFYDRWKDFDQVKVDGKLYAMVSRWGYYGIVYNSNYITEEEASSTNIMFDPKVKGKVVLFDWYLPNMGILSRYTGNEQPYDLTAEQLAGVEARLTELKPQVGIIAATNADTIQALANESAWISFGGEWLQVLLKEEGRPIEVLVPDEGGVSWTESVSIVKSSQNKEAAKAFIQYLSTPEVQAKLAWSNAFHSTVPNKKALDYLTDEQAKLLRMDDEAKMEEMLANIATRKVPENEADWQAIWDKFKG
ncbi:ABC transporter substrate-binding protein [Yanshouia hominis]|uniref:Spermidine/putrescine ABC transporter substrate-binding protein n=1 Tax=Yanshouia hominis TaxID=2763673 RepID=A0ABR7NK82_9FIRM|nr:spermidine/putrescine ABC transporter substrate-binding protein [Yanshouia hominis]MBC8576803.1 spermidine/putrescine ABC transporter substrate-binding protein [Yanshouia hominis]